MIRHSFLWIVLLTFSSWSAASAMAQWPAPTPISPVGSTSETTPEYRWGVVEGATWYQLWVNDSTGNPINRWYAEAEVAAESGECSITPAESLATGEATWWVRAWNASTGNGPWSVGTGFVVVGSLAVPVPVSPVGSTSETTPEYRWGVVEGATWYQLWVNDSTGNPINRWYAAAEVAAESGECSITPAESLATGEATWWVRAWNASTGNGPWSVGATFAVTQQVDWATVLEVEPDPNVVADEEWRERIISTGLPWRVQDDASGIEMLLVPPGTFEMGCSASNQYGCDADEFPVHEVTLLQPIYLGRYEVTQAQWAGVTGSNPSLFQSPSAEVPSSQVPNRPVERVSWNMIQDFEAATGLRLPTEAEWEYACRAGTSTAYNLPPNGTNDDSLLDQLAWSAANAASQTRPVGRKQANSLGLHDMHGNVYEWCEDWYGGGYYIQSPAADPPGPSSGPGRVLRGGYFADPAGNCRASFRNAAPLDFSSPIVGVRVARTP